MLKYLLLALAIASANASAAVFKCKGPDGKTQFSDSPCKVGNSSEIVPDRAPVTQQQRYEAQQRAQQLQSEAAALDEDKAAARASQHAQRQRSEAENEKKATAAKVVADDTDAIANCVRDVERRGAPQNVKAEMLAACRTAGLVQRTTGISGDAVSNCVKNVERTGASEKEKARQMAICHGGDVPPEPQPPPKPRPTTIMSCDSGGCWDDVGNRYNKGAGGMFRGDGKFCQKIGNMLQCN